MSTKVLVTGAEGQLAKCLAERYEINEDNIDFVFVSRDSLDISKEIEVIKYFESKAFDYCVNCAAYTNVEAAEDDPDAAFKGNASAVGILADVCRKHNIILIHMSTDYIFDGKKGKPYDVDDAPLPLNVYGASKLKGELVVRSIMDRYFIIRTSWLYSPYGRNFVKAIVDKVQNNAPLQVITSQTGSPTSCYDLSEFIYFIIKQNVSEFGIYHFSALNEANWHEFAAHIISHFPEYDQSNFKAIEHHQSKAKRPAYSVLNLNKTKMIYNQIGLWQDSVDHVIEKLN